MRQVKAYPYWEKPITNFLDASLNLTPTLKFARFIKIYQYIVFTELNHKSAKSDLWFSFGNIITSV